MKLYNIWNIDKFNIFFTIVIITFILVSTIFLLKILRLNEYDKEGLSSIINIDLRSVFESDYNNRMNTIVIRINDVYGRSGNKIYNIDDNTIPQTDINWKRQKSNDRANLVNLANDSNEIIEFQSELKGVIKKYSEERTNYSNKLNTDTDDLFNEITLSNTNTASAILSISKTKQQQEKINKAIADSKNKLYGYAKRINEIINKIPNKIPDDISIGVIASVPNAIDADISIDTVSGKIIDPLPSSYSILRANFPSFGTFNELIFISAKWVMNMLIPKNPKGYIGKSGLDGPKGPDGLGGTGGIIGDRGKWGVP